MKRTVLVFLLAGSFLFTGGQAKLDSLLQALPKAAHDSEKVKTLYGIGSAYMDTNPDSSMLFAEMALQLAQQINFKRGEALSHVLIGNNLWKRGEYSRAFESQLKALKIFEEITYPNGIVSIYNNLALIYEEQHDYKKALENFIKAKDYYEQLISNYEKQISQATAKGLAQNDLESLHKQLMGFTENLLIVLMNIGNDYEKINKLDSALYYQGKAHALAIHINDKSNIGNILTNLGNIYFKLDQKDLSLSHYRSALSYLRSVDDKQVLSEAHYGISAIYHANNQVDSSIMHAKASLLYAREGSYTKGMLYASQMLAEQYEKINHIDSAFVYMKTALTIKDTLMDETAMREIQVLSMKEQLRQEGMAAERLKAKNERVENLQWLSISLFIITFFSMLLLLSRSKARPKFLRNLGLLGLLLLFEFISVFLHPYIGAITHHIPVFTLLIAVAIASLLLPLHHKLEEWVEHTLARKKRKSSKPKAPVIKKIRLSETEEEPRTE